MHNEYNILKIKGKHKTYKHAGNYLIYYLLEIMMYMKRNVIKKIQWL
jgi:hypothetical protein